MSFVRLRPAALVAATALALAGCAQHGGALPPGTLGPTTLPNAAPPDCKGQTTTKDYATLEGPLKTSGGTFCIPAFGGFGGSLRYPNLSPSVDLTLTSSIKNYDHLPKLASGKAIVYLQFAISGAVTFGSNLKAGGGLTGAKLVAGDAYTAYGQATVFSEKIALGPCYAVATKGKYGGVIGGLGTLVEDRSVPTSATGVIEIYSGQQTSTQC